MSLVAESVRTDIDLAGPFEPSTTFANREVREYFGVAERAKYGALGHGVP